MQLFWSSVQGVLMIFFIIGIGYCLARKGWFDERIADVFLKLVLNVSLPFDIIVNVSTSFTKDEFKNSFAGIAIPFFSILLTYFAAYIFARAFKIERKTKGVFMATFTFSNSVFIGLPICRALFGDVAIPYSLMYYIASTVLWWTMGVYGIACDTGKDLEEGGFSLASLKRVFNAPLLSLFIGIVMVFTQIKLPFFIFESMKMIGRITTPLSLFYIGIVIYNMEREKLRISRQTLLVFIGRFLIAPALTLSFSYFVKVPQLMRNVFIIMAAMPVMANTSIVSRVYGADYEFATSMITYSTIFSLIVIPVLMVFISRI